MDTSTTKQKLYIEVPAYSHRSNGIKCLYFLAYELGIKKKLDVSFIARRSKHSGSQLPDKLKAIPHVPRWSMEEDSFLLCSESVNHHILEIARKKGIKVLWWIMSPCGLLEKQRNWPIKGDHILIFSSFVFPRWYGQYFYYQPEIDKAWLYSLRQHRIASIEKKMKIAIYCGKGCLTQLDKTLQMLMYDAEIIPITRAYPSSREKLFKLLSDIDGLVTFDELSQLSLESTTLGVPVYLANPIYPAVCYEDFPIKLNDMITHDSTHFTELVDNKRSGKASAIHMTELFINNSKTVDNILRIIKDQSTESIDRSGGSHHLNNFARYLKKKNAIQPYYEGQSPGAFLLNIYLKSIKLSPSKHKLVCRLIHLFDTIGAVFFHMKTSFLFTMITMKVKHSRITKKLRYII